MFFEVGFAVLLFLLLLVIYGWFAHVANKNRDILSLKQGAKNLKAALDMAENRIARLNSERVPLRSKCWCKHDAVAHGDNGCRVEYPFRWACACQISRDEVYYTPEPMRKMLPLGES